MDGQEQHNTKIRTRVVRNKAKKLLCNRQTFERINGFLLELIGKSAISTSAKNKQTKATKMTISSELNSSTVIPELGLKLDV